MRMKRPRYLHIFRDRHGKPRAYYRRPARPRVPLPLPLYGPEFWSAYRAADAAAEAPLVELKATKVGAARPGPGTVSALIEAFYRSPEMALSAPEFQGHLPPPI
jgi:hypothetical protein